MAPGDGEARDIPVLCSVVIAARDEERRIDNAIRNLLAQREVSLEVIVVDDRSTDRTEEILTRLTQQDYRVRMQRVQTLPNGWLGKCYECHIACIRTKARRPSV